MERSPVATEVSEESQAALEIRWRCERIAQLLEEGKGRLEAISLLRMEANSTPWLLDCRPPPGAMPLGYIHSSQ